MVTTFISFPHKRNHSRAFGMPLPATTPPTNEQFKVFGAMSLTLYATVLPVAYFTTLGAIPALRTSVFLRTLACVCCR